MTAILEPQTAPTAPTAQPVVAPPPIETPEITIVLAPVPVAEPVARPVAEPIAEPVVEKVRPRRVLSAAGVRVVCVALIVLFSVSVAVQPPADGPQPVAPWWATALNVVIQLGLVAVLAGVLTGRRWAVRAGLATGVSLLALSISCPIDGHHVIAAWWFVQMAMGIAMTALPAAVLRRTQTKAG